MDTMMMEPWNLHETSCFGSPYASSFSTVHLALTLAGLEIATLSLITIHKEVIFGGGTPESVKRPRWSWIILTWPSVSFVEDQKLTIIRELSFVNIFSSHKCAPEVTQIVARTRWKRYHGLGLVSMLENATLEWEMRVLGRILRETCGSAVATLLDHWMLLCSPMITHLKITERGVDQHSCRPDPLVLLWLTW